MAETPTQRIADFLNDSQENQSLGEKFQNAEGVLVLVDNVVDAISRGLETSPDALNAILQARVGAYHSLEAQTNDPLEKTFYRMQKERWEECLMGTNPSDNSDQLVAYCVEMSKKTLAQAAAELRNFPNGSEPAENGNFRPASLSSEDVGKKTFYEGSWYMTDVTPAQMEQNQQTLTDSWKKMATTFAH